MDPDDYEKRFGAVGRLFSREGMERLARARVCVIGVGGVGSWTAEALARSGVGSITLVDLDDVCVSNVNRQLHALEGTVGQPKTEAMAGRIRAINPRADVVPVPAFLTDSNAGDLLSAGFDVVADAIDNGKLKARLIATCRDLGVPVVTCGGAGGLTDPTRVRVDDLSRTFNDTLLHAVRKRLRQHYRFPRGKRKFGVPCVFSDELQTPPQMEPDPGPDPERAARAAQIGRGLNCDAGLGTAAWVTGAFGLALASAVARVVIGAGGRPVS